MSGLIMSVTPGKMGELLKAYLVKQVTGTPISRTAPIILAERITDFISLVIIGMIGAYIYNYGRNIVLGVGLFFLIVVVIISNKHIALPIINQFERIKYIKKYLVNIHAAYESSYLLLRPLQLFYMTLLSLVSWSFECLGYHLILINFKVNLSYLWASFSYAFATIIGAISMLPGGLGLTEGSLTYMLIRKSYSKEVAVASTFIIRAVTLWFAVLIGIVSVSLYQKRFGKITDENINNNNSGEK
jgi:glycosyltransferase 2 family protein